MGTIRIVAGRLRGRRLRVPNDPALRPTSDKVREAIFNILGQNLSGFDVLDLYAGSGALGFEALSRGARTVVFVESNLSSAASLRRTSAELGVEHDAKVIVGSVETSLDRARLGGPFHVILADPPYEFAAEVALVEAVDASQLLGMHGTLVVERERRNPAETGRSGLKLARTANYGRTSVDFFKY